MQRFSKIIGLILLFVGSFAFFLFLTFPYEVLKETASSEISKLSGMDIQIGSIGPLLPIGLEVEDLVIRSSTGPKLELSKVEVSVGLFSLFLGELAGDIRVKATEKDYFAVNGSLSILALIRGSEISLTDIGIKSRKFPLGEIADFALFMAADSPTANPLIAPLLKQISFEGKLRSDISADFDLAAPRESMGKVKINLQDALLRVTDASLDIPNQDFELAKISGRMSKGKFKFDSKSGIRSSDLEIGIQGGLTLKQPIPNSSLNMNFTIVLKGPLKSQFGFIMDAVSGAQSDGKISLEVAGTIAQPSIRTY